ncbi:hypothetical protein, conserved [Eimeria acervulina]|uniref:Uncharacterized protein n=1 Tax=Eimeria acervulina TaxID=5801 RepID=U6GMJ2_EIMAC|nr:hypothetical protein, conserved [Eimeria acervulina]CDI81400.1 hypothetical protein, conserved [Eimeria acervulina]
MASEDRPNGSSAPGRVLSLGLEPFCFRQFDDPKFAGTKIPLDKDTFLKEIAKENAAMTKCVEVVDASKPEWFIVAIKAQDEPFELPMNPITIMRNALIEEGGSGVSLDREAYARSVEYWSKHVVVQDDDE